MTKKFLAIFFAAAIFFNCSGGGSWGSDMENQYYHSDMENQYDSDYSDGRGGSGSF